ncbi:hypothetical protein B0H14DRAFT_2749892, partial [Mycena olivaceomarginata]
MSDGRLGARIGCCGNTRRGLCTCLLVERGVPDGGRCVRCLCTALFFLYTFSSRPDLFGLLLERKVKRAKKWIYARGASVTWSSSHSRDVDGYMHDTIPVDFPRFLYHCLFCSRTGCGLQPSRYPFFFHAGCVPAPPGLAPAIFRVPSPFARRSASSLCHAEDGSFLFGKTYFSLQFCVFYGRGRLAMDGGAGMCLLNGLPHSAPFPPSFRHRL